jgi:hypothetical protein
MAENGIELRRTETILDDLNPLQRPIAERAYELFRHRDGERGGAFSQHTANKGTVHTCEFKAGKAFRSVHFPVAIDPDSIKATYHEASIVKGAAPKRVDINVS